jgi:signal transduction histidine kinase
VTVSAYDWHTHSIRWWHFAFTGVPLVAFGLAVATGASSGAVAALAVDLGLLVACWFAFGRLSFANRRTGAIFAAVLIVLTAVAIAIDPNAALLQSLVFPFVWVRAADTRVALAWNGAVAVAVFPAMAIAYGGALLPAAAVTALSLLFSLAFGTWITRVVDWGQERARLLDELTAAQDRLAAANREQGTAAERERIARDLHDTLAQSLTGLVLTVQRAQGRRSEQELRADLTLIEQVAREALAEARAVVAASATVSVDGGLAAAAERLATRFTRETGVRVTAEVDASAPRELEVVLLRCAQEALANIRKHAGATNAWVNIDELPDGVRLTVEDDGQGLAPGMPAEAHGFGISGMRERVELVGGTVLVEPRAGGGTRLDVRVPLAGPHVALPERRRALAR